MTPKTLYVRLEYLEDAAERVRSGLLPHLLRLTADDDDLRPLAAEMIYPSHPDATDGPIVMPRWSFAYDRDNGRLIRLDFRPDRTDPAPAYHEIRSALTLINRAAAVMPQDRPWQFGLLFGSGAILSDWTAREARLRPLLTPPYSDTSS